MQVTKGMSRGDRWLSDYNRACGKADEANASIQERNRLVKTGENVSKVTAQIRRLLGELSGNIESLEDQLHTAGRQYHITDKELLRRQDLIASLNGRREQFQTLLSKSMSGGRGNDYSRNALFSGNGGGGGGGGGYQGGYSEDDNTRGMGNHEVMMGQEQTIREQDQGLDMLRKSIATQKRLGMAIGDELDDHNEMLDDLSEGMDRTGLRLQTETAHVVRVTEKAKAGSFLCCIVLLILAIIVVAAVPF